jgi:SRSO17 transposase
MADTRSKWGDELGCWLKPFLDCLGHKAPRRMCPLYVSGLIGPGDRKSVQPMAARLAPGDYDQLHHFIADGVWDAAPLESELLVQADRLVGGKDAVLVIDDTAMPKKGDRSVGVAPQYASSLGKTANCQTLVSLTLACGEVPVMIALRLFLPESWTSDPARLKRAGVPVEHRAARTKPEIALAEIDRVLAAGVRFGCVLADAGYGLSAPFRQGLTARGLAWAVGIPGRQKVYPAGVKLIFPIAGRGRPRQRHIPDPLSIPAENMLADARWKNVSWRLGTKGRLKARFAAVRVRIADGPPQRIKDKGQQHLPGEEAWLIGEHRSSGEKKYYLANLPVGTNLRQLAAAVKARWICEQAHQQLKEELGLDHFEGRSWHGLHRHALMTMIAYAFLQHRRIATAGRKKKNQRPTATAEFAGRAPRLCRPCATPSSNSFFDHQISDAHTAEDKSAKCNGVTKSAKVVLVRAAQPFHRELDLAARQFRQVSTAVM